MFTKADKQFLESRFATKKDLEHFATKADLAGFATKKDLERVEEKIDRLIFTVEDLKQDHQFVVHHSTENFDTNERQDKRLDRIEHHLELPTLAFGK